MTAHEWFSNFKVGHCIYTVIFWENVSYALLENYYILYSNFWRFAEQFEKHILLHGELCLSYDIYIWEGTLWMCYGPVAGTMRMQVEEKNCRDGNWLHPEAAAALWDSLGTPSFPLGMTKERGGPLPLILNLPSSSPHIPFSPACSGFNNILWA